MKAYPVKCIILTVLWALMPACSSDNGTLTAGGGIGGTGFISQGSITSFGSIRVNGTEFHTTHAVVVVDGEEAGVGDDAVRTHLDIGKVVTVEGTGSEEENNAVANRIIYTKNLEGPVERVDDIDAGTREIRVLGQTVVVNAVTAFKSTGFDDLAQGDVVEVSGFPDDLGDIWATFIRKIGAFTPGMAVEIAGPVSHLDDIGQTFEINGLTVDYSLADTSRLPGGLPAEGMRVEAEGVLDKFGAGMLAAKIEPGDVFGVKDADCIEVTGFVTEVASANRFVVGDQAVRVDDLTEYVDGDLTDVQPGVKLEAEGRLVDGTLLAWEIEFWEPDQIEVEGLVAEIASDNEFTIGDWTVRINEDTEFEGGAAEDVAPRVNIEVKGRVIDGVLHADKVTFEMD